MRDRHVRFLIPVLNEGEGETVRFLFSRLMCDVERLEGPEEIMEKYGMGIDYFAEYKKQTGKDLETGKFVSQ